MASPARQITRAPGRESVKRWRPASARRSGAGTCRWCRRGSGAGSAGREPLLRDDRARGAHDARVEPHAGGAVEVRERLEVAEPRAALAVSAAQVRATAAIRADCGMIVPGRPAGPPAPFHHSVTWPAAHETSLQSTTVWPRCSPASPETSRACASRMTASSSRRSARDEPELERDRVGVAARRGERVEQRDRPRARDEGERALREHGDEREEREREQSERASTSTTVSPPSVAITMPAGSASRSISTSARSGWPSQSVP